MAERRRAQLSACRIRARELHSLAVEIQEHLEIRGRLNGEYSRRIVDLVEMVHKLGGGHMIEEYLSAGMKLREVSK